MQLDKEFFEQGRKVPTLVLFYEDFVQDFQTTSEVMFDFLQSVALNQAMPEYVVVCKLTPTHLLKSVHTAVMCALKGKEHQDSEKRSHSEKDYDPFADSTSAIQTEGYLEKFCERNAEYWVEEKWGKCKDARLGASHFHPPRTPPSLPNEPCDT